MLLCRYNLLFFIKNTLYECDDATELRYVKCNKFDIFRTFVTLSRNTFRYLMYIYNDRI